MNKPKERESRFVPAAIGKQEAPEPFSPRERAFQEHLERQKRASRKNKKRMDSMKEPFEETIKVTIKRNGQEMVTDTGTFALVAMNKRINDSMTETKVNVYGPTCVLEVAGMIKNMVQLLVDAGDMDADTRIMLRREIKRELDEVLQEVPES